ncbi:glucosyltransferase domain-containing protein [Pseudobutyrivibrio xylanivorans]|uniref:Glucosyl transferase GtrII n=1 Tax=Pseudobutyrivibrio xylanivorans TaxID=185007 RepID=A0A1G5S4S5_PSEXY|nr:glucosyltransferase domain-containing protein [Pseudobutyrivibrio xylanivorans]SCZ81178.1 Glucosyl transferase GtrII [Pseudobutyrivibrio xylanivorans]
MNFTAPIENYFEKLRSRFNQQQAYAFIAALTAGLVAHGYVIFNRISYHDNTACLFNLGGTYESGRWMLGFIYDIQMMTTKLFAVPVFNGILSILFIAIAAMFIVELFDVESRFLAAAIGVFMVVYPVVTSIFSFMFTSWEYQLALLLAVISAKVLVDAVSCQQGIVKAFIISALLCTVSLGIYQAYIGVVIALFLIKLFFGVLENHYESPLDYVKTGLIYLADLCVSLALWAVLRKVTMAVKHIVAVDYKGMDEGYQLAKLPQVFIGMVKAFLGFSQEGINAVLYQRAFTALIFVITLMQICYLMIQAKSKLSIKLFSLIGLVLLPIGMNIVYLLSTSSEFEVDSLMLYGDIFVYILPLLLIEKMQSMQTKEGFVNTIIAGATWIQIIAITIMTLGYTYMDNAAYMKGEIAQEQAVAYFNQMITAVKTCEGFNEDMEIILVGQAELEDGTFALVDNSDQLDAVKIEKFPRYTDLVSYEGSLFFMREHLGFGNEKVSVDDGTVAQEAAVKAMPTYPNDGSIAIVDGRVIVKLGE